MMRSAEGVTTKVLVGSELKHIQAPATVMVVCGSGMVGIVDLAMLRGFDKRIRH